MNTTNITTVSGIARSAMLVSLRISSYTGRKKDKKTQAEVTTAKGANSKQAASVYKSLFADCKELDDILNYQAGIRATHYRLTLPWSDSGPRLLPTKAMLAYQAEMGRLETELNVRVQNFLSRFDTLVAAAAFQLGALFNRDEYPSRKDVEQAFSFDVSYTPLPTAGDFRLDIETEVQQDLIDKYEAQTKAMVEQANRASWERLYNTLSHMSDRLTVTVDEATGKVKKHPIYDSMIENAQELCGLLTTLNVTNDPMLEKARLELEDLLSGISAEDFRKSEGNRAVVKQQVDTILSNYDEWLGSEKFDD